MSNHESPEPADRSASSSVASDPCIEAEIIELERRALERWCSGDPSGFLELSAPDVVYFDPYQERRLDGLPALTRLYDGLRGKVSGVSFEILNPLVQQVGDAAVLTFNFLSRNAEGTPLRWNCTEVYRRDTIAPRRWRIIQTHWSYTGLPLSR